MDLMITKLIYVFIFKNVLDWRYHFPIEKDTTGFPNCWEDEYINQFLM